MCSLKEVGNTKNIKTKVSHIPYKPLLMFGSSFYFYKFLTRWRSCMFVRIVFYLPESRQRVLCRCLSTLCIVYAEKAFNECFNEEVNAFLTYHIINPLPHS